MHYFIKQIHKSAAEKNGVLFFWVKTKIGYCQHGFCTLPIEIFVLGVARGCGWQNFAVFINLGTLYCIGMPISIILGFKHKLYAKVIKCNFTHTHTD